MTSTSFFSNSVKWHRPQYERPFPTDKKIPGPHLGQVRALFVILSPSIVYFLYFTDVGLLMCFFLPLIFDLIAIGLDRFAGRPASPGRSLRW